MKKGYFKFLAGAAIAASISAATVISAYASPPELIGKKTVFDDRDSISGSIGGTTTYTLEAEGDNKFVRSKSANLDMQYNTGGLGAYGIEAISDKSKGFRFECKFRVGDLTKSNFISVFPMHKGRNGLRIMSADADGQVYVGNTRKKKIDGAVISENVWYEYEIDVDSCMKTAVGRIKIDGMTYISEIVDLSADNIVWWYNQGNDRSIGSVQINTSDSSVGLDIDDLAFYKTDMTELTAEAEGSGTASGSGMYTEGTDVILSARAEEGSEFKGWYQGDELVSDESRIVISLYENSVYTARFDKVFVSRIGEVYDFESIEKLSMGGTTTYTLEQEDDNKFARSKSNDSIFQLWAYTNINELWSYGTGALTDERKGLRVAFKVRFGDLTKSNFISVFPMHFGETGVKLLSANSNGDVYVGASDRQKIDGVKVASGVWYEYECDIDSARKTAVGRIKVDDKWYTSPICDLSADNITWSSNNNTRSLSSLQMNTNDASCGLDIDDVAFYRLAMYEISCTCASAGSVFGPGMYNPGTAVTLRAVPVAGISFGGFFKDGIKICDDEIYEFISGEADEEYNADFMQTDDGRVMASFGSEPVTKNGTAVLSYDDFAEGEDMLVHVNYVNSGTKTGEYIILAAYFSGTRLVSSNAVKVSHGNEITASDSIKIKMKKPENTDCARLMMWSAGDRSSVLDNMIEFK